MSPHPGRLVGNDAARAVQGLSAGADLAILGRGVEPGPEAVLEVVSAAGTRVDIDTAGGQALSALSELATASDRAPLVVAAADLLTSVPALLDLLDKPGVATAVTTVLPDSVSGPDHLPPARVGPDGKLVESVGTSGHVVTRPNRALLGVLRVAAGDRAAAGLAWREAATLADPDADPFALAVLSLVRSGIPVQSVPLGHFAFTRGDSSAVGSAGDPWKQRLRGASRGGDGFLSTYAVRPLSRKVTGIGLGLGWSPNAVTATSLAVGLLAAGLVATGDRWLWVAAAVLFELSLVLDCVDGEIARFTRRFSAFGAWLDAVGDRVKEYSVFAALALVAAPTGDDAWTLAILAMAVVTVRHLEDYSYDRRLLPLRRSRPDLLPFDQPRDLGPANAPTSFSPPLSRRQTVILWVKHVIHMPIAERYLLISLALLTGNPRFVLWLLIVTVSISVIWTQGGRTLRALNGRDGVQPPSPATDDAPAPRWGHLDVQLDLGPVARVLGRMVRMPFLAACLAVCLLTLAAVVLTVQDRLPGAFLAMLLAVLAIGAGARPPVAHVMDWQLPALLWMVEAVVVGTVGREHLAPAAQGFAFALLAAAAYHRYDVVYRLRDTGQPAAAWLGLAGFGVDGRLLVVLAVAAWAPGALPAVLGVGATWLAVLYLAESTSAWRRWIRTQHSGPVAATLTAPAPGAGG